MDRGLVDRSSSKSGQRLSGTQPSISAVFAEIILLILTPRLGAIASQVKGLALFGSIEDLFFNLIKCNNRSLLICDRFFLLAKEFSSSGTGVWEWINVPYLNAAS